MAPQCKVFISHTTQDNRDLKLAHELAEGLRSLHAEVWIAPDRIPPGTQWEPEIVNGILGESTHFLVIISAASTASEWVLREIKLAQQRYKQDQTFTILPLLVGKESNYPYKDFLAQFQVLPYHDEISTQLREVAAALQLPAIEWSNYLQHIVNEFEFLPLSPIAQDGISMNVLEPVRLVKIMPAEKHLDIYQLQEVVNDNQRFVVVGPSGSGKTTALRWVTFKAAKLRLNTDRSADGSNECPIPVFVSLSLYEGSLLKLLEKTLEVRGITFHASTLKAWLKQHPILLLLDGYDLVTNKNRFLADLSNLKIVAPEIRFVLTSRPIQTSALAQLNLPRFEVSSLYDYQIKEIFKAHLDDDRAIGLFQLLENRHLLDAFRLPLMAWLISLAYREPISDSLLLAKGLLYHEVLARLLKEWESQRYPDFVDYHVSLKLDCLARLGYEMVFRNISTLEEREADSLCSQVIQQRADSRYTQSATYLLDQLFSIGLLVRSVGKVSFWHPSFRDYFAAVWLSQNYKLSSVLRWSGRPQWHESIVFLASLLGDSEARSLLRWLLKLLRFSVLAAQISPYSWAANQIFLTLRCLNNTRLSHDDLKDKFLSIIADHELYLSGLTVAAEQVPPFGAESVYIQFYSLIGQLGTRLSLEHLLNGKGSRRYRVYGLAQFRDITILLDTLKDTSAKDTLADEAAAHLLLKFPPDVLLPALSKFIEEQDITFKVRLLKAINYCFAAEREGIEMRYGDLKQSAHWVDLLTTLSIHDPHEEIRDEAFSIIRNFWSSGTWLPSIAEQVFLKAIEEGDADIKSTVIWYLVYSKSTESLNAIKRILEGDDLWLCLRALDVLRIRDSNNFPDHVVKVLRHIFTEEFDREKEEQLNFLIQGRNSVSDVETIEKIYFLTLGALLAPIKTFRLFSVRSLALLKLEPLAPILDSVFQKEDEERVREEALWGLCNILGDKAESYLLKALEDPSPRIRSEGARLFIRMPMQAIANILPRLQTMMKEDPNKDVRLYAKITINYYDEERGLTVT